MEQTGLEIQKTAQTKSGLHQKKNELDQRISEKDQEIREKDQKIHKLEQEKQRLEQEKQKLKQSIDEGPRDFSRQRDYGQSFPFNIRAPVPWVPDPVTADPLLQETNHATSQAKPNFSRLPHVSRQRKRQASLSTKENVAKKKAENIKKETTTERIKKEIKTENIKREDD